MVSLIKHFFVKKDQDLFIKLAKSSKEDQCGSGSGCGCGCCCGVRG